MATNSEILSQAVEHHRAGRLVDAEAMYRQILQVDPNQINALHFLGLIAHQTGHFQAAVDLISRAARQPHAVADVYSGLAAAHQALNELPQAIAAYRRAVDLKPQNIELLNRLGKALIDTEQLEEATDCYRRILAFKPDFAEAHYLLGNIFKAMGKIDEAVANYQRVVDLIPSSAQAHGNLAVGLMDRGDIDEAIASYRRAVDLDPKLIAAYGNLGNALAERGMLEEALFYYRRAVEIDPRNAEAHCNLGTGLKERGKIDEAIACYQTALKLKPLFAEAYSNLGIALKEKGQIDDAIACYRKAMELCPESTEIQLNHGNVLTEQGMSEKAISVYRRSLESKPDHVSTLGNLGSALKDQRKLDEAITCYRRALELRPKNAITHNNLLMTLQYHSESTLSTLAVEHAEFDRRQASFDIPVRDFDRNPDRRLRIGFVSPDLCRHPVGYFLTRCIENLDRDQFEIVCYSDKLKPDDLTERFRATSHLWRDSAGRSNLELFEDILGDRIDILFDLAGHTAKNRLLVFARKPAPIQITWAGYVGTTGLRAMDYILADRFEIPSQFEADYTEQVLRMPHGYVSYDPPSCAPGVSSLPALDCGFVTFGCFNNPAKITTQSIKLWANVLDRIPDSRLVLKYKGMNDAGMIRSISHEFSIAGIVPDRIEYQGWSDHSDLLAEYQRIDIALDPIPYSGGLTTLEALWMGVPVITLPGETFASRHSLSHLSNVGLTETIAKDADDYVHIATRLASALPQLSSIRSSLRNRVAASPLCNGKQFASDFGAILRDTWHRVCREAA